jgi:hypothetical protein
LAAPARAVWRERPSLSETQLRAHKTRPSPSGVEGSCPELAFPSCCGRPVPGGRVCRSVMHRPKRVRWSSVDGYTLELPGPQLGFAEVTALVPGPAMRGAPPEIARLIIHHPLYLLGLPGWGARAGSPFLFKRPFLGKPLETGLPPGSGVHSLSNIPSALTFW